MASRCLVLLILMCSPLLAVTLEVVDLYQPLSLHGTDGIGYTLGDEDPVQAGVFARPFAVTGAMPEDLVKAVASPHRIETNSEAYEVKDANLMNLCGVALRSEIKGGRLLIRFDVSQFKLPEEIDLTARQVLQLSIIAVERTLRSYFREIKEDVLSVSIGITGTSAGSASLRDLAKRFRLGGVESTGRREEER